MKTLTLLSLLITLTTFAQQREVISVAQSTYQHPSSGYSCSDFDIAKTVKNTWKEAVLRAEYDCNSNVQLLKKIDESVICSDYSTTLNIEIKALFACVAYDTCRIPSQYCKDGCCD